MENIKVICGDKDYFVSKRNIDVLGFRYWVKSNLTTSPAEFSFFTDRKMKKEVQGDSWNEIKNNKEIYVKKTDIEDCDIEHYVIKTLYAGYPKGRKDFGNLIRLLMEARDICQKHVDGIPKELDETVKYIDNGCEDLIRLLSDS